MIDAQEEKNWRALLAPYKQASWSKALIQLANTAIPFVLLWALMAKLATVSYPLTLLLAIPAAALYVRLFIFQHDCGHGAFFPSRRANNLVGGAIGVITLFPYGYWRRTHAIHHATAGNLDEREFGDIETITVDEYLARGRFGRLLYRMYRHPLVFLGIGPAWQFLIKHRFPFDIPLAWKREWASVLLNNLAILVVGAALASLFGWQTVLLVHVPIVLIAGAVGVWLFYVQHQFNDTYWDRAEAWDFYRAGAHGSSFYDLGPVLHWLTGNIGYHHIHHLSSQIPNYRLAEAFHANPSLQRVTRLTLRESFACAKLKLWDEERRMLIRFDEIDPAKRAATRTERLAA
jgi:omega-6 fatty acid desaturase (delta-12 desaturase)